MAHIIVDGGTVEDNLNVYGVEVMVLDIVSRKQQYNSREVFR